MMSLEMKLIIGIYVLLLIFWMVLFLEFDRLQRRIVKLEGEKKRCFICAKKIKSKDNEEIRSEFYPDINQYVFFCSKKCVKKYHGHVKIKNEEEKE